MNPVQLTLSWDNDSTGQGGRGSIRSFCQNTFPGFQRVSQWVIQVSDIALQFGDDVINITATDNAGNSGNWRTTADLCEPYLGAGEVHAHWTGSKLFIWSNDAAQRFSVMFTTPGSSGERR